MKRLISLAWLVAMTALPFSQSAQAQRAEYDSLVATHAQANGLPEALVHRVIVRESRYQPHLVGRGGTIGLMQIKLATARSLGYTGDAAGLRDPATNLTYAVKYLAGAYRAANGDANRAVSYYASGYYFAEKRQRLALSRHEQATRVDGFAGNLADARAQQVPSPQAGAKGQPAR
jgi:soluble lytic murein transglycosylase-like protein